jgi:hypothetical protein
MLNFELFQSRNVLTRSDSVYGLVSTTGWTTGVRSPARAKDFSSSLCVQTGSRAHPASCTMGTGGPDHSPPSSAEVVNE